MFAGDAFAIARVECPGNQRLLPVSGSSSSNSTNAIVTQFERPVRVIHHPTSNQRPGDRARPKAKPLEILPHFVSQTNPS